MIDCICGKRHEFGGRIFDNMAGMLSIMPRGIRVLYLGNSEESRTQLANFYRVCTNENDAEDIKLIAGEGSGVNKAKYLAQKLDTKLAIIGCGGLNRFDFFYEGGGSFVECGAKVDGILFKEPRSCAIAFAECLNALFSIADCEISALLYDNTYCRFVTAEAKKTVKNLIKLAKNENRHSLVLKNAIMKTQLKLAVLSEYTEENLLNISAGHQCAAAVKLLFDHEGRAAKSFNLNAFLFAPKVARLYAAFLDCRVDFSPPPDNNFRAKRLSNFCGISHQAALKNMPPPLEFNQTQLMDYRLSLYADKIKSSIYETLTLCDDAYAVLLRLFPDDGFFLKTYLDAADIEVCTGLAPDILKANTLLSYMRQKGVLDALI